MNFPKQTILNNMVEDYLIAVLIFIGLWLILKLFQSIILVHLKKLADKTETDVDDVLIEIASSVKPAFYLIIAIWGGFKYLTLSALANKIINAGLIIMLTYQVIASIQIFIDYVVSKRLEDSSTKSSARLIGKIFKVILWVIGILMIMSNLGVDVTSLIAGLGIGGIAVALAIQNILGDLFSSLTIHLDKPFVVGDYIIVGKDDGVVEKIGVKTTRIRSLQGEEIVISNKELTTARVHNLRKMKERRVALKVGVTYDTDQEKMSSIPKIFEEVITGVNKTKFGRAHFKSFEDSALLFELVYFINDRDYDLFMDINQQILLGLKQKFEENKIEFAYPSQTIYLEK